MLVDIHKEIKPGASLGGITLETPITSYPIILSDSYLSRAFELVSPLEARYFSCGKSISVTVDVSTGQIAKVSAHMGYKGRLWQRVYLGQSYGELKKHFPDLTLDESDGVLIFPGYDGVALSVDCEDPTPRQLEGSSIHSITVFSRKLIESSGWRPVVI